MSEKLSVENYNNLERGASNNLPNYLLQAFVPDLFNKFNYSSSIDSENCLWKYIDTMQEFRFEDNLKILGKFLTQEELDVAQWLIESISEYTKKAFNLPSAARNSITRSLISYRYIKQLKSQNNIQGGVLEVGPGCGYLGALLGKSGFNYASTDISQGFYLYQNHIMTTLFGDKFSEGAYLNTCDYDFNSKKLHHIPWWHYADLNFNLPDVSIVVVNHVLAEMHPNALRFFLSRLINKFKSGDQSNPIYIFVEGFGNETFTSSSEIVKLFHSMGVKIIENRAFYDDTKILSTISIFEISEGNISTRLFFPRVKYVNYLSLRSYIKAFLKFMTFAPIENRFQKNFELSFKNFLNDDAISSGVSIDNLRDFFNSVEPNYSGTKDENFLSYCNGLL